MKIKNIIALKLILEKMNIEFYLKKLSCLSSNNA